MAFAFDPPARPAAPIAGEAALYPIHRIYCVGRNYAAHAREMGADPDREPPFFFSKPADAAVSGLDPLPYPPDTEDLHHEIELVVAIGPCPAGASGSDIAAADALSHVFGYAVGVDLTRRDRQAEAKKLARPWDVAKGFDRSAPMSPIMRADGAPPAGRIWLKVAGDVRQQGDLADMIWPVADIIAALSRSFELVPGDLIFTGTPEGVGPIRPGQRVEAGVDGVGEVAFTMGALDRRAGPD